MEMRVAGNQSYKSIDYHLWLSQVPRSHTILQCQPSRNRHLTITNSDLEILLIVDLLVPL